MKFLTTCETYYLVLSRFLKSSNTKPSVACASLIILSTYSGTTFANRFDPPSLKIPLESFNSRMDANIFNVDFLLAHVVNNSRKIVDEAKELGDVASELSATTSVFTNNSSNDSATAGSVVIPAGTTANTIIIINQNEGDSIAIQR